MDASASELYSEDGDKDGSVYLAKLERNRVVVLEPLGPGLGFPTRGLSRPPPPPGGGVDRVRALPAVRRRRARRRWRRAGEHLGRPFPPFPLLPPE